MSFDEVLLQTGWQQMW